MTQLDRLLVATAAAAMLSSCGGGDSPTPTATSTPTPSATATPTPTPTPTFSYSTFSELTGVQEFGTPCFAYSLPAGVPTVEQANAFDADGLIDFDADTSIWTVNQFSANRDETFGPDDIASGGGDLTIYSKLGANPSLRNDFILLAPSPGGVSAEYGRIGSTYYEPSVGEPLSVTDCTFGVATMPGDLPAETSITFSDFEVGGAVYNRVDAAPAEVSRVLSGTGSAVWNTSTGKMEFRLSYTVTDPGGAETTVSPVSGIMDLSAATDRLGFSGSLNEGGDPEYRVLGAFFGPQGSELGFVAFAEINLDSDPDADRVIVLRGYSVR